MTVFARAASVREGDRLLGKAVFLLLLGLYLLTFTGLPDNPDAEVEFQTTRSLATSGRMALGGTPEADFIVTSRFDVMEGGPGREGRFYSWFGIGQALAGVPFYYAGNVLARLFPAIEERHAESTHFGAGRSEYFAHLFVGMRNPLLAALTGLLLCLSARRIGTGRRPAFVAALLYGTTTFAWPQARSGLSDVQATFFLLLTFHQLLRVRERYTQLLRPRWTDLFMLGAAAGAAFLTRAQTAPAIAVLALATLPVVRWGRKRLALHHAEGEGPKVSRLRGVLRDLFWIAVPALLALGFFLEVNELRFGDMLETGYSAGVDASFFAYPAHLGLAGILFAPGKGLLWMAPLLLLLPRGIAHARGRGEVLWMWTTAGIAVAVLAPVVVTATWHGAWTYGPRYALPLLPFLWLGVALALNEPAPRRRLRLAVLVLSVAGLLIVLPGVLVDHMTHQDLAVKAARTAWPDPGGDDDAQRENGRFQHIQWDWRFAAPWAHWRILRHRSANEGEEAERFPTGEIFFVESEGVLVPTHAAHRGFSHFAWVDFTRRLRGPLWPAVVVCTGLLLLGLRTAARGLDRTHP